MANVVPIEAARRGRAIDQRIAVTLFPDEKAQSKTEKAITFRRIAEGIAQRTAASKPELPYIKLATFGERRTAKNCLRSNANVLWIHGVEGDHDAGDMQPEEARRLLAKAGLAAIIYTTASHSLTAPHWRVLAPLSHPYPPEAREKFVARLNGVLRGALAGESFTLSQSFYYGRVDGAPPISVEIVDGRALNKATELEAGALDKERRSPRERPAAADDYELRPGVDWEWIDDLLAAIPPDKRDDYKVWCDVGMALHYLGEIDDESEDAYRRWEEWSEGGTNTTNNAVLLPYKWSSFYDDPKRRLCTGGKIYHYATTLGGWKPKPKPEIDPDFNPQEFSVAGWRAREIQPPDFLIGEILSTTTRGLLFAPTGLGKTNFSMALGFAIAGGEEFLHWTGSSKPRRVLIIDGEMPEDLIQERLEDAARREGAEPDNLFLYSAPLDEDMPPLNTEAGQRYADKVIERFGAIDFVIFDNVQALAPGGLKDPESWEPMLPWAKRLTGRKIGQLWIHHTGRDETHAYGDSSREWQLDIVMKMEKVDQPSADIEFKLSFPKARRRKPSNRADFDPVIITLHDDEWKSENAPTQMANKLPPSQQAVLAVFEELHAKGDVTYAELRHECIKPKRISDAGDEKSRKDIFSRAFRELASKGLLYRNGDFVSPVFDGDL